MLTENTTTEGAITDSTREIPPFSPEGFEDLFKDAEIESPDPTPENGETELPEKTPKKKEPRKEEIVTPVDDIPLGDEEVDYDNDTPSLETEEEDNDDEEPEKETEPANETVARKLAKENGRKLKELEVKHKELELDLERIRQEREDLEAKVKEYETTRIQPRNHPDFVELQKEILEDMERAADILTLKDPTLFTSNFGHLIQDYIKLDGLSGVDRRKAVSDFRQSIMTRLELTDLEYNDLEAEDKREVDRTINEVLAVVQRNTPKTKKLLQLDNDLHEKARRGTLAVGVREYESSLREISPVLDSIGTLSDELIESDPFSPESIVSKLAKESPEIKRKLEAAKRDVIDIYLGPRALTQEEIEKLENTGTDVKKFMVERQKAIFEKRKKLAPLIVHGLATRTLLKQYAEKLAKYEADKEAEESELDALRQTSKENTAPVKEKDEDVDLSWDAPLKKLFG